MIGESDKRKIRDFFSNDSYAKCFIALYELQKQEVGNAIFLTSQTRPRIGLSSFNKENIFLYVEREDLGFKIKIRNKTDNPYNGWFSESNIEIYKELIRTYNINQGWYQDDVSEKAETKEVESGETKSQQTKQNKDEKVEVLGIEEDDNGDNEVWLETEFEEDDNVVDIDEDEVIVPGVVNATVEEQGYAKTNKDLLEKELEFSHWIMSSPNKYSALGQEHKERQKTLHKLLSYGYDGHLYIKKDKEEHYYFMDSNADSFLVNYRYADGNYIRFVNVRDEKFKEYFNIWHGFTKNQDAVFSRNVVLYNWFVNNVDVVFDNREGNLYREITDKYLREALIRNKDKKGMESIIQSIQQKQNEIRTLSAKKQIVVQGCAGSGKTVIMLHRLGYLLYNKYLDEKYYLLVPGRANKEFIKSMANKQGVFDDRIKTYTEYYKSVLKETPASVEEHEESVLPAEYLKRVYSEQFVKDAYTDMLKRVEQHSIEAVDECFDVIKKITDSKRLEVSGLQNEELQNFNSEIQKHIKKVQPLLTTKYNKKYETLEKILNELYDVRKIAEMEMQDQISSIKSNVSEDELSALIESDFILKEIRLEIEGAQLAVEKSSFFTADGNKRKLKVLLNLYNRCKEKYKNKLEQERIKAKKEEIKEGFVVVEGVKLSEFNSIVISLEKVRDSVKAAVVQKELEYQREKEEIELRCKTELDGLVSTKDNLQKRINTLSCVEKLEPLSADIGNYIYRLKQAIDAFCSLELVGDFDRKKINRVFNCEKTEDILTILHTNMLESYRRVIKDEFDIPLSNTYKHYWFLRAYSDYLIYNYSQQKVRMIFIDEAQDLSVSEYYFIMKTNKNAILNLFGDINQNISIQGINYWSRLPQVFELCLLDENFRNTNQIIDYCNRKLPSNFKMKMVAVDGDQVSEFPGVEFLCKVIKNDNITCVVKDVNLISGLASSLENVGIRNFKIYTVKQVKGLEFKKVCVFDKEMTDTEKYIAYTRALSKLYVVKNF